MLVIRAKAMRLLWLIGFLIDVVHSTSCGSTSKLLGNSPRLSTKSDEKMMIYNPESELMLGVVIPVTDKSVASDQCVARDAGLQTVEAILYTLDIVNKDLPFTLGAVVLDTCYATELAVENTVKLILPTEVDRDVNIRYRCSNDTPAIVNENRAAFWKVVGIIGSETSAESLQMTYILEMGRSPQISHLSSASELSNIHDYPSFMRTVPSDDNLAKAIVSILNEFKWTYISAVYDDTYYGIGGYYNFENEAKGSSICLAVKEQLKVNQPNYSEVLHSLMAVQRARAVVIFASVATTGEFLSYVCRYAAEKNSSLPEFAWIVTNFLVGRDAGDLVNCSAIQNVVIIVPLIEQLQDFDSRFTSLRPSKCLDCNPWMTQYFETNCNFNYLDLAAKNYSAVEESCAKKLLKNYRQDPYLMYASDAVMAYSEGLKHLYLDLECPFPRDFSQPLCSQMKPGKVSTRSSQLIRILRNITFTNLNNFTFRFYNQIDGLPYYSVLFCDGVSWHIGGEYCNFDQDSNCGKVVIYKNMTLKAASFKRIQSRCSAECAPNAAKKYPNPLSTCCWTCENCTTYEFVNRSSSEGRDDVCIACKIGFYPDENFTCCSAYTDLTATAKDLFEPYVLAISSVGLLVTLAVSAVLWFYRQTPLVKASDLYSSLLLLCGCCVAFASPLLLFLSPSTFSCSMIRCAVGLCQTLIHATVFAKSIRINCIFNRGNRRELPKVLKHRFGVAYLVLVFVGIQLIVASLWIVLQPPDISIMYDHNSHTLQMICQARGAFYLIVFALPVILSVPSIWFAFKIRKVPDGFNEGRATAFLIYTNFLLMLSIVPLLVSEVLSYEVGVLSLSVLLELTGIATLSLLFAPKLYILFIRPEKNTKEAVMSRWRTFSSECDDNDKRRRCSTCSGITEQHLYADSILNELSPRRSRSGCSKDRLSVCVAGHPLQESSFNATPSDAAEQGSNSSKCDCDKRKRSSTCVTSISGGHMTPRNSAAAISGIAELSGGDQMLEPSSLPD